MGHDTDAVLEWMVDGQPADWLPDFAALEAAKHQGLIVFGRGKGLYALTEDGEFAAQVLS